MIDFFDVFTRFVPSHKLSDIQDRIIDMLGRVSSDQRWHELIQSFRSDAAFRETLTKSLERATKKFIENYHDKKIVVSITNNSRFWDNASVQSALQEIVSRPSSLLKL